uniref:Uncharacterized protein n=1 Tax=Arundo donax TaxID=35708 RepID=A0A0A9F483_ARUDO
MLKHEYVRIKIGCRDVTKVPELAEGCLGLHFYDFHFERELEVDPTPPKVPTAIPAPSGNGEKNSDLGERTRKKQKTNEENGKSGSNIVISGDKQYIKTASSLILITPMAKSAPPKVTPTIHHSAPARKQNKYGRNGKLMADAMKSGPKLIPSYVNPFLPLNDKEMSNEVIDALKGMSEGDEKEDLLDEEEGETSQSGEANKHMSGNFQVGLIICHFSNPIDEKDNTSLKDNMLSAETGCLRITHPPSWKDL